MTGTTKIILLSAIPGLMFCVVPMQGMGFRFSWQLVSIWLAGLAFAAILSNWFWRIFFLLALAQVIFNGAVITSYITLMMIAIFLAAAEGFSRLRPDDIMDAMCVAGVLLSLWVIGQRIGLIPYFNIGSAGAGPFNGNAAGVFLALTVPAFLRRAQSAESRARRHAPCAMRFALPVVGVGIWLCGSTTGMIAALAGLAVWALISRPGMFRVWSGVVMATALCSVFFWKVDPLSSALHGGRWPVWERVVLSFESAPFGRGLGSFAQMYPQMIRGDDRIPNHMRHTHNEYLQVGFEMGIQGMLLIIAYPIWIGITAWRKRNRLTEAGRIAVSGIAALAVSCLGWHTFHIAPLAVLGSAWMGMGHRALREG